MAEKQLNLPQFETLSKIRAVVGYLGEREQYAWWSSSFFSPSSQAFLSPVFSRTRLLTQVNGVTRAASIVHDERIGVGQVYHLFRLPEDIEQGIHHALYNTELGEQIITLVSGQESAMTYLRQAAADLTAEASVGPIYIGDIQNLRNALSWSNVIANYIYGFDHSVEVYPYFAERL